MSNQQNSANSIGDVQIREAYDHEPARKDQDYCIGEMKEHARLVRTRDESGMMRCATFDEFDEACETIGRLSKISRTKVYPALRHIGYRVRYTEMKQGSPDALYELGDLIQLGWDSGKRGLRPFLRMSTGLFTNVRVVSYRAMLTTIGETETTAELAGVKLSELNLFNALSGLELLTQTDPDYYMLIDELEIKESIQKIESIRTRLIEKTDVLKVQLQVAK